MRREERELRDERELLRGALDLRVGLDRDARDDRLGRALEVRLEVDDALAKPAAVAPLLPQHTFNLCGPRMRARAASVFIATVDNAFPADMRCSSPSGIVGPQGEWLSRCVERGEQFLCREIPLE